MGPVMGYQWPCELHSCSKHCFQWDLYVNLLWIALIIRTPYMPTHMLGPFLPVPNFLPLLLSVSPSLFGLAVWTCGRMGWGNSMCAYNMHASPSSSIWYGCLAVLAGGCLCSLKNCVAPASGMHITPNPTL